MTRSYIEQKREFIKNVFILCERLGIAVVTATGGAAIYWHGHRMHSVVGLLFTALGSLVIILGFFLSVAGVGIFLQDHFGNKLTIVKNIVFGVPLVLVTSLFFVAVVKLGVSAFSR